MKKIIKSVILTSVLLLSAGNAFAGEISIADGGEFNITSKTTFGIDLDNPYRYGIKQELTDFNLVLHLVPYQMLSNKVRSNDAVGFIDFTLFHLDLMTNESWGYNAGAPDSNASLYRNRFQTGSFIMGIAKNNWVIQMNAGCNEPFWSPWNKSISYTNDKVKFSWANLDSVVDVKRSTKIKDLKPEDCVVSQFQQDGKGATDQFGLNLSGATIGALYNSDNVGLNLKFATEYPYGSESISETNHNGLAAGFDTVITPQTVPGLRVFASAGGSYQYGKDVNSDPIVFGGKAGYSIALNDDISVEPYAGADVGLYLKDKGGLDPVEFEFASGVTVHWPGMGGWYVDYIADTDGRVFPGMSLAYTAYGKSNALDKINHSVKFTLFEPRGDEGLFYKIGSEIVADCTYLGTKDWNMMLTTYFDYEIPKPLNLRGSLIPTVIVCYDNLPSEGKRENALKLDLGLYLDKAISNTKFGLVWNTGDLLGKKAVLGFLKASCELKF